LIICVKPITKGWSLSPVLMLVATGYSCSDRSVIWLISSTKFWAVTVLGAMAVAEAALQNEARALTKRVEKRILVERWDWLGGEVYR